MATLNPDDPTLIATCAAGTLPSAISVGDCWDPTLNYGPGTNLYMSFTPFPDAVAPATDAVTTASITTKLAATDAQKMVGPLIGQFTLAPGTEATDRLNGRYFPKPSELSMACAISDTSKANYDFARSTQKGGLVAHFWIVDRNGNFFGGQNGIFGNQAVLALRLTMPTDELALQTLNGSIKALGFFDPQRTVSPIAAK